MAGYSERCGVCNRDDREVVEAHGAEALAGAISWRQAALPFSIRSESLKRHMESHVVAAAEAEQEAENDAEIDALIARSRAELLEQFDLVPADIKPLVIVALQSLKSIKSAKGSMETLIKTLKTIQEMTGMKNEQRMLLEMSRGVRRPKPIKVANVAGRELGAGE